MGRCACVLRYGKMCVLREVGAGRDCQVDFVEVVIRRKYFPDISFVNI